MIMLVENLLEKYRRNHAKWKLIFWKRLRRYIRDVCYLKFCRWLNGCVLCQVCALKPQLWHKECGGGAWEGHVLGWGPSEKSSRKLLALVLHGDRTGRQASEGLLACCDTLMSDFPVSQLWGINFSCPKWFGWLNSPNQLRQNTWPSS